MNVYINVTSVLHVIGVFNGNREEDQWRWIGLARLKNRRKILIIIKEIM